MILQHLLMPKADVCLQEAMYVRIDHRVRLSQCDRDLTFQRGGVAWFDTYFNGFSIEKWKKYTQIGELSVTLRLQGRFEIQLRAKKKVLGDIVEKGLGVTRFESREPGAVTIPIRAYDDWGMYFIRLEALSSGSRYFGGHYSAEVSEPDLAPVDLALNICTFRREPFVKRNLELLRTQILNDPDNDLSGHLQVFISDNGKTLDISALSDEKVHIVPNKNVGGAGGFTRGLIEILHCQSYSATHVLFMDDDVLIEPEALYRTYTFLRCLKPDCRDSFLGGAMLRLDLPNVQIEAGAIWRAGDLTSLKQDLDLNQVDACLYNETEEYCEYNAWWYCCVPMDVVRSDNLPLPIFIRGDDLEYGLRNMKRLILLNGVCVWHEPFENKFSSFLEYYILRNLLYDNALHCPGYSKWKFLRRLYGTVLRQLMYYRYQNVDLIFRGIEDFFRGAEFLRNTDGEKLHQEIMAAGYKPQPVDELPTAFSYPELAASFAEGERWWHKFLRLVTFNGLFLPAKRNTTVPMAQCRPINFYRAKQVLQYDVASKKAFITDKSVSKTLGYLFRLIPMTCKVIFGLNSAMTSFRREAPELMGETFWREYLQIADRIGDVK